MKPVIVLILFLMLLLLGFWQLNRYHDKQALLHHYRHHRISMSGHYLKNRTLLLQNRFYHGKLGFEVLTPFQLKNKPEVLLINRGWVPASLTSVPTIGFKTEIAIEIHGILQTVSDYQGFTLGKNILMPIKWPLVIQKIDITELQALTHLPLSPFILRLDANLPSAFQYNWQPVVISPEQHLGYAIQWFAMAVVLIIACGVLWIKQNKGDHGGK